jgi:hypothetical protein
MKFCAVLEKLEEKLVIRKAVGRFSLLHLPHTVGWFYPSLLSEAGYTGKRYGKKLSLC